MIKNIIFSLVFACLLLALTIKLVDPTITHVSLGGPFLSFIRSCSLELNDFKISIPDIPMIPKFEVGSGWQLVLNYLIEIVNALSGVVNFIILVINTIIQILQFLFIVLKNIVILRDELVINA